MKKKFLSLALTLTMILGLMVPSALAKDRIDYSGNLESVGDTIYARFPVNASDDCQVSYVWSSSGSGSVSIDDKYSLGTNVTATCAGYVTLTCVATVYNPYTSNSEDIEDSVSFYIESGSSGYISSVSISPSSKYLDEGDSVKLTATVNGSCDEEDVYFDWYSNDSTVATASASGYGHDYVTVKAKSDGDCWIWCEATYDGKTVSSYCNINVSGGGSTTTDFLSLSDTRLSLNTDESTTLRAYSSLATVETSGLYFTWSSSNSNVASVSSSGGSGKSSITIYGNKAGTATITCKATFGDRYTDQGEDYATCTVTVSDTGSFYISSNLDSACTATYGTGKNLSFTLKNTTGYTANYQWYVDGIKDNSSSSNTFNTKNLSIGSHKVYCYAYTSKGNYNATTGTCTVTVNAAASTGSMNNFKAQRTYYNQFGDVYTTNWFYPYVKTSYEYGLVNGKSVSQDAYCPFDNFTVAEALKIAACVHSTYYNGYNYTQQNLVSKASGATWYNVYADYCISTGIINIGDFSSYTLNCTRGQMAYIFSRCLPASELTAVRDVSIPDCNNTSTQYYSNIQTLYNAGIVSGDGGTNGIPTHFYYPTQNIKRSEVAKIVCTLTTPSTRDRTTF